MTFLELVTSVVLVAAVLGSICLHVTRDGRSGGRA